jgi:hypothetical protein
MSSTSDQDQKLVRSAGELPMPRELYRRLQSAARLLEEFSAPPDGPCILWHDAEGHACVQGVRRALVVGRGQSCDVVLASSRVSRRHCELCSVAGDVHLVDLNSANGTVVNGESLVEPRLLIDGDVIEVGGVCLVFVTQE